MPEDMAIRQKAIGILRDTFESYGFEPLETPSLEYASILMGKYGEEADKLVYSFDDRGGRKIGLRYDLTVPTCRVLATYGDKIPLPFKRYQVQNVFRAEKPQRGRYREFTQCDIDTFGVQSPLADAEIIEVLYASLKNLGFEEFIININSRKVLLSMLESSGISEKSLQPKILNTLDKAEKITKEEIEEELAKKGLSADQIKTVFLSIRDAKPDEELNEIFNYLEKAGISNKNYRFLPTMVRGLDYYTRAIYETYVTKPNIGSITGGGRYDTLVAQLGGPNITGTGSTIGLERIIEVIKENNLWPELNKTKVKCLVTIFSPDLTQASLEFVKAARNKKIATEVFINPDTKIDKQLRYASQKGVPYVVVIGPDEAKDGKVVLKNMATREQQRLSPAEAIKKLSL